MTTPVYSATITRLIRTNRSINGHTLRTRGAPLTMLANSSSWTVKECSSQRVVTTKHTSPSQKRMEVEVSTTALTTLLTPTGLSLAPMGVIFIDDGWFPENYES